MNLEKFDFFDIQNFDGAIIVHNANMFSPKGVCRVQDKAGKTLDST